MAAIKNLYSGDAVFFEADQWFEGRQRTSDAVEGLQASLPL
jgi:ketosteroid isomerase-like protein